MAALVFMAAGIGVCWSAFQRKPLMITASLGAAGIVASYVVFTHWPATLTFFIPDQTGAEAQPASMPHLELAPDPRPDLIHGMSSGVNFGGGNWNGISEEFVNQQMKLKGLHAPYFITLAGYHMKATMPSGRVIEASFEKAHGRGDAGGVTDELRQELVGAHPMDIHVAEVKPEQIWLEVFNYQPDRYPGEDMARADKLEGSITLKVSRLRVVKTLPLKTGGVVTAPRSVTTIGGVIFHPTSLNFVLSMDSMTSDLRGAAGSFINSGAPNWIVFNPVTHKALYSSGQSQYSAGGVLCDMTVQRLEFNPRSSTPGTLLAAMPMPMPVPHTQTPRPAHGWTMTGRSTP